MEAHNIQELINIIRETMIGTKRIWWFRGHASQDWKVMPSVWRDYNKESESYMTNEFLFKARTRIAIYPFDSDLAGWISLMQHHQLPTRLLDWSKSPLIALYFAVHNYHRHNLINSKDDACLWLVCPGELNKCFGHEELIYPLNSGTVLKFIEPAFKIKLNSKGVIAASSIESHHRMIMQQSAFTVHSDNEPLEKFDQYNNWLKKIILPQKSLSNFAKELEILGITVSSVFPDLDNLSKEIRNLNKPKER